MKASCPIDVTLSGMMTEVKFIQVLKTESPMEVTLFGMVTEVRLLQLLNA